MTGGKRGKKASKKQRGGTATYWPVPLATLSVAGRVVVLRPRGGTPVTGYSGQDSAAEDHVEACISSDEQLRTVVFGDPLMHMMSLYRRRIEVLATRAVTRAR